MATTMITVRVIASRASPVVAVPRCGGESARAQSSLQKKTSVNSTPPIDKQACTNVHSPRAARGHHRRGRCQREAGGRQDQLGQVRRHESLHGDLWRAIGEEGGGGGTEQKYRQIAVKHQEGRQSDRQTDSQAD